MTEEQLNQKAKEWLLKNTDREYLYPGDVIAAYKAGVESAQPEWKYVERDGLPDTTLSVDISYTCDGWIGGNLDQAYFMDGIWHKGVTPINPNWRVYAWKIKTYKTAAPLPPAKNQ